MLEKKKERGLGRGLQQLGLNDGLDELLSESARPVSIDPKDELDGSASGGELTQGGVDGQAPRFLPIDLLLPCPDQPRTAIDAQSLEELANSIREHGVIQPIIVRPTSVQPIPDGSGHSPEAQEARAQPSTKYEIIAGERRWRAARLVGLTEIPVIVRVFDDKTAMTIALIENIQREDLNAIETAIALNRLVVEHGATHEELAKRVGKSRSTVSNLIRLLNLAGPVQRMLANGELDQGHARALLALSDTDQIRLADIIINKGLSVRAAESLIRQTKDHTLITNPSSTRAQAPLLDDRMVRLQARFSQILQTDVQVKPSASKSSGQLVIRYRDLEFLESILDHLV